MNEQLNEKIRKGREKLYATVKANAPERYMTAVQIGHLPLFVNDKDKAAYEVEAACMGLIADCLGLRP